MISSGTPNACASFTSRPPSRDSRTAEVATAIILPAPAPSATALKSRSVSRVRSIASDPRRSSSRSSRPRRSGARASSSTSRCSPGRRRKTIIRAEFEPTSTTANGRSSCRARRLTSTDRCSHTGARIRKIERAVARSESANDPRMLQRDDDPLPDPSRRHRRDGVTAVRPDAGASISTSAAAVRRPRSSSASRAFASPPCTRALSSAASRRWSRWRRLAGWRCGPRRR